MEKKSETYICKKHNRIRELVNVDTQEVVCPECSEKKSSYIHIREFIDVQKISSLISQAQGAADKIAEINNDHLLQIKKLYEIIEDFSNKRKDLVEILEKTFCDMSSIEEAKKLLKDLHNKQKKGIAFFLTSVNKISQLGELKSTFEREVAKPVDAINIATILDISNQINQYDSKEIISKQEEIKSQYEKDSALVQSISVEIKKSYSGIKSLLSKENTSQIMEKGLDAIFQENKDLKEKVDKLENDIKQREIVLKREKETELKELDEKNKKAVNELNTKYNEKEVELNNTKENHASELANLKSSNEEKNGELKKAHKKALDELNKKYNEKEKELKKTKDDHIIELANLKSFLNEEKNKELNALGEAQKKALDDLKKIYNEKEKELKKTKVNHASELANLKSSYEAKNKELNALGEAQEKALDDLNKKYNEKEEELKKTKDYYNAEIAKMNEIFSDAKEEEKKKNEKALLEKSQQIEILNKSLAHKNTALNNIQKRNQELENKIANLERGYGLKKF